LRGQVSRPYSSSFAAAAADDDDDTADRDSKILVLKVRQLL